LAVTWGESFNGFDGQGLAELKLELGNYWPRIKVRAPIALWLAFLH
jgi:hypothetical protein